MTRHEVCGVEALRGANALNRNTVPLQREAREAAEAERGQLTRWQENAITLIQAKEDALAAAEAREKALREAIEEAADDLTTYLERDVNPFGPSPTGRDPCAPGAVRDRLRAAIAKAVQP